MATETLKTIDPFTNIETADQGIANQGATFLSDLRSLNIGDGGSNVFRADADGIFLGGKTFATAPFRVTMAGAITATSIVITGGTLKYGKTSWADSTHDGYYLGVEGAYFGKAADATLFKFAISDGSLSLKGALTAGAGSSIGASYITGSIVASQIGSVNASAISGSITAGQIASITAGQITGAITATYFSGTIYANQIASVYASAISGSITAGQISSVNASSITGSISYSQIGSINAATITIGSIQNSQINSVSASKLTAGTIDASVINVINLNASNITTGTLSVGGTSQPTALIIKRSSSGYSDAKFQWEGGSRMWSDTSNRIGINALGGEIYFYLNSSETVVFYQAAQAVFNQGISCRGAFNVGNTSANQNARFTGRIKLYQSGEDQYIDATSQVNRFWAYDQHEFYRLGTIKAIIDQNFWTAGNVYGTAKFFNIPHPDGSARRLQYTAQESPDVVVRLRGLAKVGADGTCEIVPVAHYSLVTEKKGLTTINLTSLEADNNLYVDKISNEKVVVNGKPNSSFMYEIAAIRKGYLNSPVEIANADDVVVQKMTQAHERSIKDRADYDKRQKENKLPVV